MAGPSRSRRARRPRRCGARSCPPTRGSRPACRGPARRRARASARTPPGWTGASTTRGRSRGAAGRCRSSRAGTTTERGRRRSARSPSSAASRRQPCSEGSARSVTPGRRRFTGGDGLVEGARRCADPLHAEVGDEARAARAARVTVRVDLRTREHHAPPGPRHHHAEQPAFVVQAVAVAVGLGDGAVEHRQVEHGLGSRETGECALDRAG